MVRLSFRSPSGDAPTRLAAVFFRFCRDGILRGPENYPVAVFTDGWWLVSGKRHREFDCEGPINLRLSGNKLEDSVSLGPFAHLRTAAGSFFGDDTHLDVPVPGFHAADDSREVTLLSALAPASISTFGGSSGKV